ncbi:MAG: Flp pilus assembly complex ATPase component TadA [Desulfofustis sp.]|nr:Flp pilus assembly complex ATPase component TadA [Desulfofustis sp.]
MYRTFYAIRKKPFELTPSSELVYLSDAHREALATLRYGIISDKGFLMLTGGIGTGKTTLVNNLLKMLKTKVRVCLLNNPTLNRREFLHFVASTLNLQYSGNKGDFILKFSKLLERVHQRKEKILIIIDEAQVFPVDLMEEVRLLSNQAGARNVLSIFLIGQPELQKTLAHPRLRPLRQRIGIKYHLKELQPEDTAHYIAFRLNEAGAANPALFTDKAIDCIHQASSGNPRLINIICDHALISGFAKNINQIDRNLIVECLQDLKLPGETSLTISGEEGETSDGSAGVGVAGSNHSRYLPVLLILLTLTIVGAGLYYVGWIEPGINLITR